MWIVQLALNRPCTFVGVALMIVLISPVVLWRTPTDIFPDISIPVVSVVWSYTGMSAQEMALRVVTISEGGLTTFVIMTLGGGWKAGDAMTTNLDALLPGQTSQTSQANPPHP